jgi:UDP-N-acetyl-D-glucosamine dehydrogenase
MWRSDFHHLTTMLDYCVRRAYASIDHSQAETFWFNIAVVLYKKVSSMGKWQMSCRSDPDHLRRRGGSQMETSMSHAPLLERIRRRRARIGVIGLGHVGAPLLDAFASAGFPVLGFDTDPTKVAAPLAQSASADCVLICVPTPLTPSNEPDLSHIKAAAASMAAHLRPPQLVVLSSTTYPGTTRNVVLPLLASTTLTSGRDFFLAYSPERMDPGNATHPLRSIPRLVAGLDSASLSLASALYSAVTDHIVRVPTLETAEAAKLVENTYRAVNIALANELKLALTALGVDVWDAMAAAATKPFGFQAFYPGPGVGGHCIPIDPLYLTWAAEQVGVPMPLVQTAAMVNASMPTHVVQCLTEALREDGKTLHGSRVGVLGVAYKPDVDDTRGSPALLIIAALRGLGAVVSYSDPHVPHFLRMDSTPLTPDWLRSLDAALVVTDHAAFDYEAVASHTRLVVDTRNAMRRVAHPRCRIVLA